MTRKGDILYIALPSPDLSPSADSVGSEAAYDRPAVVVQSDLCYPSPNTVIIVPGTHSLRAQSREHTIAVDPNSTNGLRKRTVFLPFQVRAIDISRIISQVGRLSDDPLAAIDASLRSLLDI